jgi:hypothetical protein
MSIHPSRKAFKSTQTPGIGIWVLLVFLWPVPGISASEIPLEVSTQSQVSPEGKVTINLTLKNSGGESLYHLHPMFHFHHTMSRMPVIHRLNPGQSVTLENTQHPPVRIVGSYPVVAMVRYQETEKDSESHTSVHTDSFYFEEQMPSLVKGEIGSDVNEDFSKVKISLRNPSSSFKNVRLMLLLPPELVAEQHKGILVFTLRGGEEKYFEVPVRKISGLQGGVYPVHLLVEYGELMKHYSGDIAGQINFGPVIGRGAFWPQMLVFAFLAATLGMVFYRRFSLRTFPKV